MPISTASKSSRPSGLLVGIVVIAALYFARVVFIPLALALLFSLLLTPIVSFLEKLHFSRVFAIFLVACTLLAMIGFGGGQIYRQVLDLTQQLPTYKDTLEEKIRYLRGANTQTLNNASNTVHQIEKDLVDATPGSSLATDAKRGPALGSSPARPMSVELVTPSDPFQSIQNLLGPLATAAAVAVFTIFILVGRTDLRNRFIRLASGGRLSVMTQALDDATNRINRYLLLQLMVNVCYGLIIATALHFIGIPNALLWGLSASILRFLPYVGPPMAATMPILLSLAVFSGWQHALETMAVFFFLELTVSNFLEPLLYGKHLGLSALAVLVAAIFWTLIWGFPGLLLSTPLTACLVVMGRYVPGLGFLNILLGDEPVLAPHVQYYQRLLATDPIEARQVLEQYLKEKSLEELYGSVLIPALALAKQDLHRNELDEESHAFVCQSTREILEELDDSSMEGLREEEAVSGNLEEFARLEIVCVPARDGADDTVATLLSQFLTKQGHAAKCVPLGPIPEMVSQMTAVHPEIICISALPPFSLNHARGLYLKLRPEFPGVHMVVCLWHFAEDTQQAAERMKLAAGDELFTALPQVTQHISSRVRHMAPSVNRAG